MMPLKIQAIQTALMGDWNTAIMLNQELLKENPDDIETLNRLAFALAIIGKVKEAKKIYQKVLEFDGQNLIALKNLKRLESNKQNCLNVQAPILIGQINSMFLEESGKTKIIELINIADPKVILRLTAGELLTLCIKRLKIFVLDGKKQYIGMLPDDLGKRLIKLLKGGNTYEACIKAVENHHVVIFIKEMKRSNRFRNQPSFISNEKTKTHVINKSFVNQDSDDSQSESPNSE